MTLTAPALDPETAPDPILPLLRHRHSALAFDPRPLDLETLRMLFTAASLSPSCFNEQPWRYWVGSDENPELRERLRDLLVEGNRWARNAPVLVLAAAKTTFAHNGKENRHAGHDVGASNLALMLQAESMGIASHSMAGFDVEAAAALIDDPSIRPFTMIALGYPGDPNDLPDPLRNRALKRSVRHPLEDFIIGFE